ncbi:unnamed protein product [Chrysoparadoxa australica]
MRSVGKAWTILGARRRGSSVSFEVIAPEGDDHQRRRCRGCGYIEYVNPKIVCGSVATLKAEGQPERILLCKRSIEPRKNYWTLPAGYMELGETAEEGAAREAYEEAGAKIRVTSLLAVYSLKHISQVQLLYQAELASDDLSPGLESLEVGLFTANEIPWEQLAFPTTSWALMHHSKQHQGQGPFSNPCDPASAPFWSPSGWSSGHNWVGHKF